MFRRIDKNQNLQPQTKTLPILALVNGRLVPMSEEERLEYNKCKVANKKSNDKANIYSMIISILGVFLEIVLWIFASSADINTFVVCCMSFCAFIPLFVTTSRISKCRENEHINIKSMINNHIKFYIVYYIISIIIFRW